MPTTRNAQTTLDRANPVLSDILVGTPFRVFEGTIPDTVADLMVDGIIPERHLMRFDRTDGFWYPFLVDEYDEVVAGEVYGVLLEEFTAAEYDGPHPASILQMGAVRHGRIIGVPATHPIGSLVGQIFLRE